MTPTTSERGRPQVPELVVERRPMDGPDLPWSRRRFLTTAAALTVGGLVAAACGGDDDDSSAEAPAGSASEGGGDDFPRTVEHAVGSTTIEARPERIVSATDGAELASLLALGVTPVGFGQRNDPLTPWIAEAGGDEPEIERYELASDTNFEVLASWRPDVIIGQFGFVTEETIEAYAAIAPTVATDFVGWRTSLRQTAAAVGADDRAEELIAELEGEIAAAGERLAGTDVSMRWVFAFPDYMGQLNDQSPIGALLTEMGLPSFPAQIADGEAVDEIVAEQLGDELADADAVVLIDFDGDEAAFLKSQPLYASAPAVAAGRTVTLTVEESNAAYFDSVLTVRRNLALIERVLGELA